MNNRVRCYNVVRYLHVNVRYITSDAVTLTALKSHSAGRAGASPMTRTHVQLSEPHEVQRPYTPNYARVLVRRY